MRLSGLSLAVLAALAAWLAIDFVGWRGVVDAEPPMSLAGLALAVLAAVIVAGIARLSFAPIPAALLLLVWSALQIETHWWGYFGPVSERRLAWYASVFGDKWQLLPAKAGHTVPDGYHTVLALLLVLSLLFVLRDIVRKPASSR